MTKTIGILILASAAIHAAVLGLVNFDSTEHISIGTRMRISIQAPSVVQNISPQAAALSKPSSNKKLATPSKHVEKEKSVLTKAFAPTKVIKETILKTAILQQTDTQQNNAEKNIDEPVTDSQTTVVASLEPMLAENTTPKNPSLSARTSSLLYSDLERAFALHFYYPRLAIRRGWSGEVQLSLRIEADGKLSHVQILKGSGFGLLDKAAMSSIDKVEILPSAIALLKGNSLELILPVEYRLL